MDVGISSIMRDIMPCSVKMITDKKGRTVQATFVFTPLPLPLTEQQKGERHSEREPPMMMQETEGKGHVPLCQFELNPDYDFADEESSQGNPATKLNTKRRRTNDDESV